MAVLQMTPSAPSPADSRTVHVSGPVRRATVDALREALVAPRSGEPPLVDAPAVELDLREVTEFPQLAVGVLVLAHRRLGRRLRIRANPAVFAVVEDAGLTRLLRPSA